MPRITSIERESETRFLFHFSEVTDEFRTNFDAWIRRRFQDIVMKVDWRRMCNTLVVVVKRSEAAFAFNSLSHEIRRRALFK